MKNITVSAGISAYNEQDCIKETIQSIINQEQKGYILDRILIVSDGSTDNTDRLIKSIDDSRIVLFTDGKRKGKTARINQIFLNLNSDIVIILDADIKIYSKQLFTNLIKPIIDNKSVELTAGKITPLSPISFVQKAVYAGTKLWDEARRINKNSDMYYCGGAIRAFSKKLYKEIKFPKIKAEDVYPYLYCKSKGYKFSYVKSAEIFHTLPLKLADYVKQMNRYLKSPVEQESVFGEKIVNKEFTINFKIKIYALLKVFIKNPFWVCTYIFMLLIPKAQIIFRRHTAENSYK
jgi:glycosyltransferase involved in cell wall biosynthesis